MTNHRKSAATMLFTLGLAGLTPVQQGAAVVAFGAAAIWASPASAANTIPGVGTVIKKKPGNSPIIIPSDANGETRITGLEPGTYTVRVIEGAQEVPMRVGSDGRLAFVARQDTKAPDPRAADPRARRALPVVRRWADQIAFDGGAGDNGDAGLRGGWIIPLIALRTVDVNKADGAELVDGAAVASEGGVIIVAERSKSGPYKDLIDFARRVCPQTAVDFEDSSVKFGEQTMIVKRGSDPKNPGFKCARGTGEFELFGKKHNYVGHVTLLR